MLSTHLYPCRYEPLFYFCFAAPLILWVKMYHHKGPVTSVSLKPLDAVLQFLSVMLISSLLLAFFGTGNMASISSFYLPSVYRLVTVFSPFLMAALLIAKLLIPILLLAASFGAILKLLQIPPVAVFLLVIATVDVMTLNFFFLVRDHGSWLEIGTSISHFIIASVFSILALLVFGISQILLDGVNKCGSNAV